jgi:hypothetical protein
MLSSPLRKLRIFLIYQWSTQNVGPLAHWCRPVFLRLTSDLNGKSYTTGRNFWFDLFVISNSIIVAM